jgi:hypothetical protein
MVELVVVYFVLRYYDFLCPFVLAFVTLPLYRYGICLGLMLCSPLAQCGAPAVLVQGPPEIFIAAYNPKNDLALAVIFLAISSDDKLGLDAL